MTKAELKVLLDLMQRAEQEMGTLEGGVKPVKEVIPKVIALLREFHIGAAKLGVKGLAQIGQRMERYLQGPSLGPEQLTAFTFAVGGLRAGMQEASSEAIRAAIVETIEILGEELMDMSTPPEKPPQGASRGPKEGSWTVEQLQPQAPPPPEPPPPQPRIEEPRLKPRPPAPLPQEPASFGGVASKLGGKVLPHPEGSKEAVVLEIPAANLEKVEYLFAPHDSEDALTKELVSNDVHMEKVLKSVKQFMASFAEGNLLEAQQVLEDLSDMQGGGEMFNEIGSLARNLHGSLSNLSSTLDPDLREIVEEKIPDSGDRLEHILQLTEEAATVTMDNAETIKQGIQHDREKLHRLEGHLARLKPVGDAARARMKENLQLLGELKESLGDHDRALATILTAQGYQDLTGQVIQKIVSFQKEMEGKLITIVKTFGMNVRRDKKDKASELYGPAHAKAEGALHSQDEIDALLAEFGF